jgi:Zn-dependent protease with chaperone function/uncharacterized tellurite resistance protein B-like protein
MQPMATDFFARQDAARRNTSYLVLLFVLGMLGITLAIYFLITTLLYFGVDEQARDASMFLSPGIFLGSAGGSGAVVGLASFIKSMELSSGGGGHVAESLGGQLLTHDTHDPLEKRLLNVVEEMAIASGVPAPPVYIMRNEPGINAFAAGYSPQDAVIGVTRGCLETLNRAELQGVIAHEFSHILNGDMRINIRLIGLIFGILVIGLIGYYTLRAASVSGGRRSNDKNNGAAALLALGLGLMVIGYIGTFFGNIIKAAVSRQREYLADASAVQFTRYPDGIGGALKKIGGLQQHALLESPKASEVSHMLFGEGVPNLASIFATHPPLDKRILAIDPHWDGKFITPQPSEAPQPEPAPSEKRKPRTPADALRDRLPGGLPPWMVLAGAAGALGGDEAEEPKPMESGTLRTSVDTIGQPSGDHMVYAQIIREHIPEELQTAAHDPYHARAIIFALLLNDDPAPRQKQIDVLTHRGDPGMASETARLWTAVSQLPNQYRLPLVEITMSTLRQLTETQRTQLFANVDALIHADEKIQIFEWILQQLLQHHLTAKPKPPRMKYRTLAGLEKPISVLLSIMAQASGREPERIQAAFQAGAERLKPLAVELLAGNECGPSALSGALSMLYDSAPQVKQQIIRALEAAIGADGTVTLTEAELFRVMADLIGCPVPPLLPGQLPSEQAAAPDAALQNAPAQ